MAKLLLVEDDNSLAETIQDCLHAQGHKIERVENGDDGLAYMSASAYDLIILDWMLPDKTGVEILKSYRDDGGKTPVLMLTGRKEIEDKILGLDSGADDYLTKPFHPHELNARVRSLLRRPAELNTQAPQAAGMTLDPTKMTVTIGEEVVRLFPQEYAILDFLIRHPGTPFSVDVLLERAWPTDTEASAATVRTYIKTLRKKLDKEGSPSYIHNLHGVGYYFEAKQD